MISLVDFIGWLSIAQSRVVENRFSTYLTGKCTKMYWRVFMVPAARAPLRT